MYWIEICTDGSYMRDGQEHCLPLESVEALDSHESERLGNEWAKIVLPYQLETEHGVFLWQVEIIEYLQLGVTSFLGYSLKEFPEDVVLKEEVTFCLQDGWANPGK
ncbi:hypothetical protein [Pseudomonas sp. BF-B-26]|uniref:hypothetical protein n=1 Tax=Pseudomonas sp. BF-B-26 TaxID=2832400 RepID=UPI001CBE4F3C|nr:hypothetical protein [Pseudomonas sp. BF-B-26]